MQPLAWLAHWRAHATLLLCVRAAAEMVKDRHHGENAKDITLAIREGEEPVATIRLSLTIEEPS